MLSLFVFVCFVLCRVKAFKLVLKTYSIWTCLILELIDWWYLYLTHFFSKRPSPLHGLHVYHVFAHWVPLEQVITVYFQFVRLPSHYVSAKEFICVKLTLYLMLSHAGWYCLLLNSQSSASLNLSNMARTFHKNLSAFNILSEIYVSQVNKIFKQEPDLFVTNSLALLNYSRQINVFLVEFGVTLWWSSLPVFLFI